MVEFQLLAISRHEHIQFHPSNWHDRRCAVCALVCVQQARGQAAALGQARLPLACSRPGWIGSSGLPQGEPLFIFFRPQPIVSIVHTKPWRKLAEEQSPYLPLVKFIVDSDFSSELFGGVFLSGLLISDSPNFELGVHMLRVENTALGFSFSYTRGRGGHKDDTSKEVPASEAIETLDLFLKVKYGVNLRLRKADATTIEPIIAPHRHPLSKHFVFNGKIVTFAEDQQPVNQADSAFLNSIEKCFCYYGACDCRIYSFTCSIGPHKHLPTARQVLDALGAASFKSEHIANLDTVSIPHPGYHPDTDNDEIHTDAEGQSIFSTEEEEGDHTEQLHAALKEQVVDGHLYYVLLHDAPEQHGEFWFSEWVVLFAVGISKASGNLIGILTHQACHNYCD